MKKSPYLLAVVSILVFGCKKESNIPAPQKQTITTVSNDFVEYTIDKGKQYCNQSTYTPVEYSRQECIVKFDSTAIYTTLTPVNQLDINKLFGFSDNNDDHHQFSARFGWRWSDNSLQLFGYTYNNGVRAFKKLGTVKIGTENYCSIQVQGASYIFTLNDAVDSMARKSTTEKAKGYKLYPYFGGDEPAPHDIHIWIKELH